MKQVHLECKPDETLIRALGASRKVVNHHNDKGRVCNILEKRQSEIGMVDEDPDSSQPTYLKKLTEVEVRYKIRLLTDPQRGHAVIVLCPRLEEWILDVAGRQKVDVTTFGLPDKPEQLHKLITSRLDQFRKLVEHLLAQETEPILYLQRLLNS